MVCKIYDAMKQNKVEKEKKEIQAESECDWTQCVIDSCIISQKPDGDICCYESREMSAVTTDGRAVVG